MWVQYFSSRSIWAAFRVSQVSRGFVSDSLHLWCQNPYPSSENAPRSTNAISVRVKLPVSQAKRTHVAVGLNPKKLGRFLKRHKPCREITHIRGCTPHPREVP